MTSKRSAKSARGAQQPRLSHVPEYTSTSGDEAIELAAMAGLHLDPWEALVLRDSLGEREDGKWAAFEVGLCVARQNGKGAVLEARELAGMFLLAEERTLIHSAHEFATSLEHFQRMENLIEGCSDLSRRVKTVKRSHGEEGFELFDGTRLRFKARTKAGARGFTADLVVFDEAMVLQTASHGAILPTLAARSVEFNPQVWYTGSAVDQWVHEHGLVFARVRERGIEGDDGLAYFEWSSDADNPSDAIALATDPEAWALANPGLGIRISAEHIALEQRSLDARSFAVERLGIGDWPDTTDEVARVIAGEVWSAGLDEVSSIASGLCLALDVSPDRATGSIGSAGIRPDGDHHVEVVDRRRGTGWMVDRTVELVEKHSPAAIALDGAGPAASLIAPLETALKAAGLDVEVIVVTAKEHAQACGTFYDLATEGRLYHRGQPDLDSALAGAAWRDLGEARAWSRKNSTVDISPLVAVTLANGIVGAGEPEESVYEHRDLIVLS